MSTADSTAQGASYGGWIGAWAGYVSSLGGKYRPPKMFLDPKSSWNVGLRNWALAQGSTNPPAPAPPGAAPYVPYIPPTNAEWERRRAEVSKGKAPAKPPPPKPPASPDKYPMPKGLPPIFRGVWQSVIAYAILYALPYIYKKASESWSEYFARWQEREEQHRKQTTRRRAGGRGQPPARGRPRTPERKGVPTMTDKEMRDYFPGGIPTVVVNVPGPVEPSKPTDDPRLRVPEIYRQRIPEPSIPPAPVPLWKQAGLLVLPTALPALSKMLGTGSGKKARRRDPLTLEQGPAVSYDPSAFAWPNAFGDSGGKATGTKTCECPKKKRGKRKLRTVCYKGSYVETAKGLTKRKREQVPC